MMCSVRLLAGITLPDAESLSRHKIDYEAIHMFGLDIQRIDTQVLARKRRANRGSRAGLFAA
jgi:hypothetical protein